MRIRVDSHHNVVAEEEAIEVEEAEEGDVILQRLRLLTLLKVMKGRVNWL